MRHTRKIVAVVLVAVVLIGAYYVFKFMTASSVTITVDNQTTATNTIVLIDGKRLFPSGAEGKTYKTSVGLGNHTVVASAPNTKVETQTISTSSRSSQSVNVTLEQIPALEVAKNTYKPADGLTISEAKYFGSNEWVVFFVTVPSGEGSLVVARYYANDEGWKIIDEGTDIDAAKLVGAPGELVTYLRSIYE